MLGRVAARASRGAPRLGAVVPRRWASAVVCDRFGDAEKVLKWSTDETVLQPRDDQITLKMKAALIHPTDLASVSGNYVVNESQEKHPFVPGCEGVAEVTTVGSSVKGLSKGDWVVPARPDLGTWRTSLTCSPDSVRKVPKNLSLEQAAVLSSSFPTAMVLLGTYHELRVGLTILLINANTTIGRLATQVAKVSGAKIICVVREESDVEVMKQLGADLVSTSHSFAPELLLSKGFAPPGLVLNGESGLDLGPLYPVLANDARVVTYGAGLGDKSAKTRFHPSSFIEKDIMCHGFDFGRFLEWSLPRDMCSLADNFMTEKQPPVPVKRMAFGSAFLEGVKLAQSNPETQVMFTM